MKKSHPVYIYSKQITKQYGKNYVRAVSLFPSRVRCAVYVYYAWLRHADEYVDGLEASPEKLSQWVKDWYCVVEGQVSGDDLQTEIFRLHGLYAIPLEYAHSFLQSMVQDVSVSRYEHYKDLESYMYGSAVVVGLTMLCFFGLHKENLIPGATKLGEAMQLANFLRDVREDYDELGRIYLPQEDMQRFGVTEQDIAGHTMSDNFKDLMRFEIQRCRNLYKEAWPAIEKLPWRIKFPIRVATRNYEGVLNEIEKAEYDVWSKKHSLSKSRKLLVIAQSLFV